MQSQQTAVAKRMQFLEMIVRIVEPQNLHEHKFLTNRLKQASQNHQILNMIRNKFIQNIDCVNNHQKHENLDVKPNEKSNSLADRQRSK